MGSFIGKEFIKVIITVITTGLITAWLFSSSSIEFKSGTKDEYFQIPSETLSELKIIYQGNKIENISIYEFGIFNRGYKDLSDVKLYFEVIPDSKGNTPEIINKSLLPPQNLPNIGIKEEKNLPPNIYCFKVETLKKTGNSNYYLARFIFNGEKAPEVKLSTLNKNIDIKEYNKYLEIITAIIILVIIAIIVFVPIFVISDMSAQKSRNRSVEIFKEKLLESKVLNENCTDPIIEVYKNAFPINKSIFTKWFESIRNKFQKS